MSNRFERLATELLPCDRHCNEPRGQHTKGCNSSRRGDISTALAVAHAEGAREGFEKHKQLVRDMNERALKAQIEADQSIALIAKEPAE